MTAEKCVDGAARLLTKSGIVTLQGKAKRADVERLELELERASDLMVSIDRQQKLPDTDLLEIEGRFIIRCGAHLCGKGKQTFEKVAHEKVTDIILLFMREIHDMVEKYGKHKDVELSLPASWEALLISQPSEGEVEAAPSGEQPRSSEHRALSLGEVGSSAHSASQKGFNVGDKVVQKGMGKEHGIYVITHIDDEVKLQEVNPFKDDYIDVSIGLPIFLQKWVAYKSELPSKIEGDWAARHVSPATPVVTVDVAKSKLLVALASASSERNSKFADQVYLCCKPAAVRAAAPIKKEEFRIVPLCPLGAISTTKGAESIWSGHTVGAESAKIYLNKSVQPKEPSVADWKHESLVDVIWWIGSTDSETDANVAIKHQVVCGSTVPVLTNTKPIKKHALLQLFKPRPGHVALDGATARKRKRA